MNYVLQYVNGNAVIHSETGAYRVYFIFQIFALKHRLWVLVRTSESCLRGSNKYTQSILFSKTKEIITIFHLKIDIFRTINITVYYIGHKHVNIMSMKRYTVKFLNFRMPENFAVIYLISNKEAKA